jgi:hypothetical protein
MRLSDFPLLDRYLAEPIHDWIRAALKERFGSDPLNVRKLLDVVVDQQKLSRLNLLAWKCPDLDAFREALLRAQPKKRDKRRERFRKICVRSSCTRPGGAIR